MQRHLLAVTRPVAAQRPAKTVQLEARRKERFELTHRRRPKPPARPAA